MSTVDTRAQLVALMNSKILSTGNRTTAQNLRDFLGDLIVSVSNILDDKDQVNGYLGLDANGLVDVSKIADIAPLGYYLRDDGTWQPASTGSATSVSSDLATGNTIDLTGETGELIITLSNTGGSGAGILKNFTNYGSVTKVTIYTALDLTIQDNVVSGGSSIKLSTGSLMVYGSKSGFIEFVKRGTTFYQTNYIDQYNS